jgi:hypothetical protein
VGWVLEAGNEVSVRGIGECVGASLREDAGQLSGRGPGYLESRGARRFLVFLGEGAAAVITPTGPGEDDGVSMFCVCFWLASSGVAPGSGAGFGRKSGKEGGPASGRDKVKPDGLAGAGAAVKSTPAGPVKGGAPSGFCMVFWLSSSGVAPGSAAGVGRKAAKEASPAAGGDKVRPGGLAGAGAAVVITLAGPGEDGGVGRFCIGFWQRRLPGTPCPPPGEWCNCADAPAPLLL